MSEWELMHLRWVLGQLFSSAEFIVTLTALKLIGLTAMLRTNAKLAPSV